METIESLKKLFAQYKDVLCELDGKAWKLKTFSIDEKDKSVSFYNYRGTDYTLPFGRVQTFFAGLTMKDDLNEVGSEESQEKPAKKEQKKPSSKKNEVAASTDLDFPEISVVEIVPRVEASDFFKLHNPCWLI